MTLRVRHRPFLRRPTQFSLTPLAPSFVPASVIASPSVFISDSVIDSDCFDEYELSEGTQLKVPVSSSDTKEVELPDHVNDLFLQTVEGLVGRQAALPTLFAKRHCLMCISAASRPIA